MSKHFPKKLANRIVLVISLVLVSGGGTAPGQQASASLAKPAPTPVPLAKVALEAQSALASLQEIDASVSRARSSADGIARTLLDLTNEIDARIAGDTRLLTTSLSIDLRYWLKLTWQNFGDSLLVSARELTQHSTSLEEQLARLDQLTKTWQATLQSAKQPDTPTPVLQSVQSVVDSVERKRQAAESVLAHVLTLQSRLSEEEARVRTVLSSIEQLENRSFQIFFVRDSPPIWSLETSLSTEWKKQSGEAFSSQLKASTAFTKRLPSTFLIHALFIVMIATALQWMRRRIRKLVEEKPDLQQRALPILDLPVSTAFALSMLLIPLNLCASTALDNCNHGNRNPYPNRSDSSTATGTQLVSDPRCDPHHVFLGPTPSARGVSAGVGQVPISRPNAGLYCLSCLGASELAFTNRNC